MKSILHMPTQDDMSAVIRVIENMGDFRVLKYGSSSGVYFVEYEYIPKDTDTEIIDVISDECKMCGCERSLNNEGYCSPCWTIWNS